MNSNQTLVAVCNAFKKLMFSLFFIGACSAFAQVGVGTQAPQTALHVAGANANANGIAPGALAAGDGVIVTRVTDDLSSGAVTTGCSAATQGALVYSNNAAGAGYYTCDGTNWVAIGGGAATGWTYVAQGTTINAGESMLLTAAGTIALPATANDGDQVRFIVINGGAGFTPTGTFGTNTFLGDALFSNGAVTYEWFSNAWWCVSF